MPILTGSSLESVESALLFLLAPSSPERTEAEPPEMVERMETPRRLFPPPPTPPSLHNGLKLYEMDEFILYKKKLFPISLGVSERASKQMSAAERMSR